MAKQFRDPITGRFTKAPSNAFNLKAFTNGAKALTKIGNIVNFRAFDNNNPDLMVVSVTSKIGLTQLHKMHLSGKVFTGTDTIWDIVSMAV